jgi:hypothetical protein
MLKEGGNKMGEIAVLIINGLMAILQMTGILKLSSIICESIYKFPILIFFKNKAEESLVKTNQYILPIVGVLEEVGKLSTDRLTTTSTTGTINYHGDTPVLRSNSKTQTHEYFSIARLRILDKDTNEVLEFENTIVDNRDVWDAMEVGDLVKIAIYENTLGAIKDKYNVSFIAANKRGALQALYGGTIDLNKVTYFSNGDYEYTDGGDWIYQYTHKIFMAGAMYWLKFGLISTLIINYIIGLSINAMGIYDFATYIFLFSCIVTLIPAFWAMSLGKRGLSLRKDEYNEFIRR